MIMGELRESFSNLAIEQIRANVKRTIMSYRSPWDLYTELIQNSVDAIIDRFGYENINQGKISINFDTENREIIIRDNGIGINVSDISSILVMGESLKRKEGRGKYGFMGYGFTFVSFQTNYLKIESIHDGKKASRTYIDLYKFVFANDEIPLSEEETSNVNELDTTEESGTFITLRFPNTFPSETLEKNIASTFHHVKCRSMLEYILRTKSAFGLSDSLFYPGVKLFSINVTVNGLKVPITSGHLTTKEMITREYPQAQFYNINAYKTFYEATEHLDASAKRQARKATLIDGIFSEVSVGVINPIKINVHVSMTSKAHLTTYSERFKNSDEYENLSVNNGIWLSIDGLPTGIRLDSLSHGSYLPFTVIVDVIDEKKEIKNELDSGRKGITEYRVSQIVNTVKTLLNKEGFIKYREYVLGVDSRVSSEGFDAKRDLESRYSKKSEYDIDLIHRFFPIDNEQEVITLFTELISKEYLHGYFPLAVSGFDVYDGLYKYQTDFPQNFRLPHDPLGISEHVINQYGQQEKIIIIEFKTFLKNIFRDIKEVKKRLADIDLLVCWSVEYEKINEFVASEGIILKKVDQSINYMYGVTHEVLGLGRNANYLPIIELKTVLNEKFNRKF